jgi:hypothetical protein
MRWKLLLLAMAFLALSAQAQKPFEGRIKYTIEYLSFPEGLNDVEVALPDHLTLIVEGGNYRMQQRSALAGQMVVVRTAGSDSIAQWFDLMGQTVVLTRPVSTSPHRYRAVLKDEHKMVAGIEAQRVYLQSADGQHREAWVFTRFKNPLTDVLDALTSLPLVFEMERNGIWMRLTAIQVIEEPIDATYFALPGHAVRIGANDLQKLLK